MMTIITRENKYNHHYYQHCNNFKLWHLKVDHFHVHHHHYYQKKTTIYPSPPTMVPNLNPTKLANHDHGSQLKLRHDQTNHLHVHQNQQQYHQKTITHHHHTPQGSIISAPFSRIQSRKTITPHKNISIKQ